MRVSNIAFEIASNFGRLCSFCKKKTGKGVLLRIVEKEFLCSSRNIWSRSRFIVSFARIFFFSFYVTTRGRLRYRVICSLERAFFKFHMGQ